MANIGNLLRTHTVDEAFAAETEMVPMLDDKILVGWDRRTVENRCEKIIITFIEENAVNCHSSQDFSF